MNGTVLMFRMVLLIVGLMGPQGLSIAVAHEPAEGTTGRMTKEAKETVEAFEKEARAELGTIQAGITRLQMKTNEASDEARAELEKAIKKLESKKAEARKRIEELHQATASSWSRLRAGMIAALNDARRSYRDALSALP